MSPLLNADRLQAQESQHESEREQGGRLSLEWEPATGGRYETRHPVTLLGQFDAREGVLDRGREVGVQLDQSPAIRSSRAGSQQERIKFVAQRYAQATQTKVFPIQAGVPTWLAAAEQALLQIARECAADNWDGEGNRAIGDQVVLQARQFLKRLPQWAPQPEIAADRDGRIGIDWSLAPDTVVAVSIAGDGSLYYASALGTTRMSGRETLQDTLPEPVSLLLSRLHAIASGDPRP